MVLVIFQPKKTDVIAADNVELLLKFKNGISSQSSTERFLQRKEPVYNDHRNIMNTRHLNGSKLDLNMKGTKILFDNFVEAIFDILQ